MLSYAVESLVWSFVFWSVGAFFVWLFLGLIHRPQHGRRHRRDYP